MPQTPFAQRSIEILGEVTKKGRWHARQPDLRRQEDDLPDEIDQAMRFGPDAIFCAGYTPDTIVLLKDLYRAGYKGKIIGQAYAINQKLIDQVGQPEVVEGVYTYAPSIAEGSGALERVKKMSGLANPIPIPARSTTTSIWC